MNLQESTYWAERFLIVIEGALVIQRLTSNKQVFEKQMEHEQTQFKNFFNK
jgi:hypothetical protein